MWHLCLYLLLTASKHGISEVPTDVVNLISHATQERLRNIIEKLSTIAEQRTEIYKVSIPVSPSEIHNVQL